MRFPLPAVVLALLFLGAPTSVIGQTPRSLGYVLQADSLANTPAAAVKKLAASNRDLIVIDQNFSATHPWSRAEIAQIRKGKAGRRVVCYLSIGEAEDYRTYWNKSWGYGTKLTPSAPSFIVGENPDWKGNYRVRYWDAKWQAIILKEIDRISAAGFDGLYLDIVSGFEFFEQNGNDFIDNRPNPATGKTYRQDMILWVQKVAARARKGNAKRWVIPQNGSQLLENQGFRKTVNAISVEDLFTNGNTQQAGGDISYIQAFLGLLKKDKKPIFCIEYAQTAPLKALVKQKAAKAGYVWLLTDRNLTKLGESGR